MSEEQGVQVPKEIRGVLIPLQSGQLLLPNAAVAEVIDYRQPAVQENAPEWLLGSTDWRQRKLPVIRLETLLGLPVSGDSVRQRIAVCHSLNEDARRPFFGIVTAAIPRLVRIREEMLSGRDADSSLVEAPLLAEVLFDGVEAMIPDLARIERLLVEAA